MPYPVPPKLNELALSIAIPAEHKPHRMPSFPSLERTAVLAFTTNTTYSSSDSLYGFLCRSPTYPLWISRTAEGIGAIASGAIGVSATPIDNEPGATIDFPRGISTNVTSTSTAVWPVGYHDSSEWVYVPPGGTLTLEARFSSAMFGRYTMWLEGYSTGDRDIRVIRLGSTTDPTGQNSDTVSSANRIWQATPELMAGATWIRLSKMFRTGAAVTPLVDNNLTVVNVDVSMGAAGEKYLTPIQSPPEITNSRVPYSNTRLTACAALISNVSSALAKEGTIHASRHAAGSFDPFALEVYPTAMQAAATNERYFGPLEKGLYVLTLPDAASENFLDCVAESRPVFNLTACEYYYIFHARDMDVGNTSTLAVTLDRHLEFRTSSRLFPVDFSRLSLEDYHVAQMGLAQFGCFHENPVHLAALAALARAAIARAIPYAMPIVRAALPAARALAVEAGGALVNKVFGPSKPAAQPQPPARPRNGQRGRRANHRKAP